MTAQSEMTISEAQDLRNDLSSKIHELLNDYYAKTGLWVHLQGGFDLETKRHQVSIAVEMPGSKG